MLCKGLSLLTQARVYGRHPKQHMVVSSFPGARRFHTSALMIQQQDLRDIGLDGSGNDYKAPCQRMRYPTAEPEPWKGQWLSPTSPSPRPCLCLECRRISVFGGWRLAVIHGDPWCLVPKLCGMKPCLHSTSHFVFASPLMQGRVASHALVAAKAAKGKDRNSPSSRILGEAVMCAGRG